MRPSRTNVTVAERLEAIEQQLVAMEGVLMLFDPADPEYEPITTDQPEMLVRTLRECVADAADELVWLRNLPINIGLMPAPTDDEREAAKKEKAARKVRHVKGGAR